MNDIWIHSSGLVTCVLLLWAFKLLLDIHSRISDMRERREVNRVLENHRQSKQPSDRMRDGPPHTDSAVPSQKEHCLDPEDVH